MKKSLVALAGVLALVAVVAFGATAGAKTHAKKHGKGKADSGTSYVAIVHQDPTKGIEYAAGWGTDKLFHTAAVTYALKLTPTPQGTVQVTSKKVTLYTAKGSLSGTGSATVTLAGSAETISNGKLDLTKGKGSQKGHSFVGTFTGTGSTTTNTFTFNYTGTYK